MSTTRLQLEQLLSEQIGDFLEFASSGSAGAGSVIIKSTALQNYDGSSGSAGSGGDDYFNNWWVSFQDGANLSAGYRQVYDYSSTAGGWLYLRGAAMTAESAAITLRLHRFNPNNKWLAISRSIEQIYPTLYKPIDNIALVTGNMLPNAHFEDWADSAKPDFWELGGLTALASTTVVFFRAGKKSVAASAGQADGFLDINSDYYRPLLDLMGQTVDAYVWAYPVTANDAYIRITTEQASGSTQTLSSTTACPANKWTMLKLEGQALNDDLVAVQFKLGIKTNAKLVYFDDAVLVAQHQREYPLPSDFQTGVVSKVRVQSEGYSDPACYDLLPRHWGPPEGFDIMEEGDYSPAEPSPVYKRLQLHEFPVNFRRMRIEGFGPISPPAANTATIYLDGEKLNLIVAKAAAHLYRLEQGPVSSQDKGRYYNEIALWENEYRKLVPHLGMIRPSGYLNTGR